MAMKYFNKNMIYVYIKCIIGFMLYQLSLKSNPLINNNQMLFKACQRFNYTRSILKAAQTYKNSATQRKMHEFDQNQSQTRLLKKQIDFDTIRKQSQGYVIIREFLFQQDKTQYQANYPHKYLVPSGKWTIKQIQKMLQVQSISEQTPSQNQNKILLKNFDKDLHQKLLTYYNNIGKKDYTFSVNQQIRKIQNMTPSEFEDFISKLKV